MMATPSASTLPMAGLGAGGPGLELLGSGLRISKVAPAVERDITQVTELVQLMRSGGAGLSDTQSQRLVGYLGSLEDMRSQIGVMSQYYEEDEKVIIKLTLLLDRIDESLSIVQHSTQGIQQTKEEEIQAEKIILEAVAHNPLIVSTKLGVSGLPLPRLFEEAAMAEVLLRAQKEAEEEAEEDGGSDDEYWDHPITEADLASLDITTASTTQIPLNLSQSFMEEPETTGRSELTSSATASSSNLNVAKGKGKGKGKGKEPCAPTLCKICYDEYTDPSVLHSLSNCEHVYCRDCLTGFLTIRITSGGVLDLDCPNPECEEEINILDIYKLCDEDTTDKYDRFVALAALRADPNVRWCPMMQCSNAIKGPPKDGSEWVTCEKCLLQVCFACGDERHDPASCGKEARELIAARNNAVVEAERSFIEWHEGKPTDVKPCPKCKAYIEKNQGCNHMTCVACRGQFCWLCLGEYAYNHYNDEKFPNCKGKQYWFPPVPADPELAARYNWIYFPPNYQYEGVDSSPLNLNNMGGESSGMARARKVAKKVGVYVGVGVAVATLGIPAAVVGGPIYGVFKLHKKLKAKRRARTTLYY